MTETWDEIRMQARVLENRLDAKLSAFGKVCFKTVDQCTNSATERFGRSLSVKENGSIFNDFDGICHEIDDLLEK